GALAPPAAGGVTVERGVAGLAPAAVLFLGVVAVGRTACQLAAIALFSTTSRVAGWDTASTFDPGNYRVHTRVAQAYLARGDCKHAAPHARTARALFPNAAEPRRLLSACGAK